ncbi:RNA-directed DNA polymerase, eukaryota, reverse transcriptase zinc-binding domain protein [Tanacetum coccineum]
MIEEEKKASDSDVSIPPGFGSLFKRDNECSNSSSRLKGKWKNSAEDYFLINVYGPQQPEKFILWDLLRSFILNHQGNFILFGDLNEVRCETERFGSNFPSSDATIFNAFIQDVSLVDLPMGGKIFTWMNKSVTVLDRVWSDHNPILLHCQKNDFGPTPFKVYHSWFERCDFDNVVKETWNSFAANDDDEKIDAGQASDDDRMLRVNTWHELDNLEKLTSMDLIQKARIRWDVEGDENFKFFHGIFNSKRKSQSIQGILQEGVWISDPSVIKMVFLNFYKEKFSCHDSPVILPSMSSAKSLSDSGHHLLDSMVSLEEIKNAV